MLAADTQTILKVENLSLRYLTRGGEVQAVQDVSFDLAPGQALGLVGESGCGKTSVANCLLRILPDNARLAGGRVILDGRNLLDPARGRGSRLPLAAASPWSFRRR